MTELQCHRRRERCRSWCRLFLPCNHFLFSGWSPIEDWSSPPPQLHNQFGTSLVVEASSACAPMESSARSPHSGIRSPGWKKQRSEYRYLIMIRIKTSRPHQDALESLFNLHVFSDHRRNNVALALAHRQSDLTPRRIQPDSRFFCKNLPNTDGIIYLWNDTLQKRMTDWFHIFPR